MEESRPAATAPTRVRVRSRNACDSCRTRKRKCDGTQPCAECRGYGFRCSFQQTPSKATHEAEVLFSARDGEKNGHLREPLFHSSKPDISDGDIAMGGDGSAILPQATSRRIGQIPKMELSVLEPYKSRFMSAHSAVAFARSVGVDLGMPNPPRLHSYAWHTGIRAERLTPVPPKITQLLSLQDSAPFLGVYLDLVNPLYGILNRELFMHRCNSYWSAAGSTGIDFEAVICGVIALGSLFSKAASCPIEWELVEHARLLLESSVSQPPALVSLDHVVSWILRSLYLRLTSRPHISWLAISITMHLAESIGLHQEIDTVQFAVEGNRRRFGVEELDTRRRIFWVAWSLNRIFASEYGRSTAHIDNIRCRKPSIEEGDFTNDLIALAGLLPISNLHRAEATIGLELGAALEQLPHLRDSHPAFILLKADVCLILCRLLRLTNIKFSTEQINEIISLLQKAWMSARSLALQQRPWWNVLSVPFHSVCLLLSINSPETVAVLAEAMGTLVDVSLGYDTHLAREAVSTARLLIRRFVQQKRDGLDLLEGLCRSPEMPSIISTGSGLTPYGSLFEGLTDDNLGWTQFFASNILS